MGFVFSKLFSTILGKKDMRILLLGLDNAGKTTILSIGFNVETVTFKNLKFEVWDLGGQTGIRPYWRSYYPNTNAIIYVIDSQDRARLQTSKQELMLMLQEEELKNVPLLVLANKQDLVNSMPEAEISEYLGLTDLKNRQWAIYKCSGLTGFGLNEGMEWLVNCLKE